MLNHFDTRFSCVLLSLVPLFVLMFVCMFVRTLSILKDIDLFSTPHVISFYKQNFCFRRREKGTSTK